MAGAAKRAVAKARLVVMRVMGFVLAVVKADRSSADPELKAGGMIFHRAREVSLLDARILASRVKMRNIFPLVPMA
jgi:hypothetical protein